MVHVSIIGSGNVAQHLIRAFESSAETEILQVYSRHFQHAENFVPATKIVTDISALNDAADIYIIAVSDTAISEVSSKLPFSDRLVAHTAGSLSLEVIDSKNRAASFYPLQTFSKSKELEFNTIPVCIETRNESDLSMLKSAASAISDEVKLVNSVQRLALHVAAVFVSNFTNHMYSIGEKICRDNLLDFNVLKPLIEETALKVQTMNPRDAQTGPARRKDHITVEKHRAFLTEPSTREIYDMITKSISSWE